MSDFIKHECGIVLIRLLKPLSYYNEKYGTPFYGLTKLSLLMQKQRNRGQDGAGIATIKLDPAPGTKYISRKRNTTPNNYLADLFKSVYKRFKNVTPEELKNTDLLKRKYPYMGELLMGHLRYGTHGDNGVESCHPFLRQNNWISRNLVLAGNFNLTNVDELFGELIELGQYPKEVSDTVTVLEKIGHFLDDEVQRLHSWYKPDNYTTAELNQLIFEHLDIQRLLKRACRKFDGGYVMGGMIGHGDAFMMRDAHGIRPAFYYHDDEVLVAASERPAIQTAFDVHHSTVKEIPPGTALIVKKNGKISIKRIHKKVTPTPCSFERIYFSRGTDRDIYIERKMLGEKLAKQVLKAIDYDLDNSVFSFIPNTAETSFYGLIQGAERELNKQKIKQITKLGTKPKQDKISKILNKHVRIEKLVVKDAKLRTFITSGESRNDLVSHVYDVTYGIVKNDKDTLILIDDSIVRGTTLKTSIIKIVSRLRPKKIVIVSSAPQIRYPDCYGIDMSKMGEFVAFRALLALLKESGQEKQLQKTYEKCKASMTLPKEKVKNHVKKLYDLFSYEEVSHKISEIIKPEGIKPDIEVIFQKVEDLHDACPNHSGDWYFTGVYPTPGGNKVVNKSFILFMEGSNKRAY